MRGPAFFFCVLVSSNHRVVVFFRFICRCAPVKSTPGGTAVQDVEADKAATGAGRGRGRVGC